jgi:hypothetical protein
MGSDRRLCGISDRRLWVDLGQTDPIAGHYLPIAARVRFSRYRTLANSAGADSEAVSRQAAMPLRTGLLKPITTGEGPPTSKDHVGKSF